MAKYVYPAIVSAKENGGYSVRFPDVGGCAVSAGKLAEVMEQARDALCLMLYNMEESGTECPTASTREQVQAQTEPGEFINLIGCNTAVYRKNDMSGYQKLDMEKIKEKVITNQATITISILKGLMSYHERMMMGMYPARDFYLEALRYAIECVKEKEKDLE